VIALLFQFITILFGCLTLRLRHYFGARRQKTKALLLQRDRATRLSQLSVEILAHIREKIAVDE